MLAVMHATLAPPVAVMRARAGPARLAYLDRLKVLLVGVIVAVHGVAGYTQVEGAWPYQPFHETEISDAANLAFMIVVLPGVLAAMGLFFLLSGLVTPGPLARKGPARFARDRLVRLGVPLAVWTLGIWPALVYAANRAVGVEAGYWKVFMGAEPFLDTGPMWFVAVLLAYSLAYAAWRALEAATARPAAPVTARTLLRLAAAISAATVLIRPVFEFDGHQPGEIQLWQWPQYLGMFWLGIAIARGGRRRIGDGLRRLAGRMTLAALAGLGLLLGAVALAGIEPEDAFGERGLHWAPLWLAALEGPLAAGFGVWALGTAQRVLDGPPGRLARAAARSAFAAFILQGPVLIGLALALRPLDLAAEAKAPAVALAGVALSFGLAWLLVSRTPLRRLL